MFASYANSHKTHIITTMHIGTLYALFFTLTCAMALTVFNVSTTTLYLDPYSEYKLTDNLVAFRWNATGVHQIFYVSTRGALLNSVYFNCTADETVQTCNLIQNYTTAYVTEAVNSMIYTMGDLSLTGSTYISLNDGSGSATTIMTFQSKAVESDASVLEIAINVVVTLAIVSLVMVI